MIVNLGILELFYRSQLKKGDFQNNLVPFRKQIHSINHYQKSPSVLNILNGRAPGCNGPNLIFKKKIILQWNNNLVY